MIKRIHIKHYRSIENLEFRPSCMCALVGENNAGKSNICRAVRTVLGKDWLTINDFVEEDFIDHDPERGIVIEIEFDPAPIYQADY